MAGIQFELTAENVKKKTKKNLKKRKKKLKIDRLKLYIVCPLLEQIL